jgi:AcrR family transcriptional regulator
VSAAEKPQKAPRQTPQKNPQKNPQKTGKTSPDNDAAPPRRRAYLPAAERRQSILDAAQGVFVRNNLQGARTRDIAKAADINQAVIFEHFASKEALFQEAVVQPLIDAMQGMHERLKLYETAATPADLAQLAQQSTQRHLEQMIDIFPLLATALFSDLALGRKLYREQILPLIKERGDILAPLTKPGINPQFVGLANFGMLLAVAMDRYLAGAGKNGNLAELAREFNSLSTSGFAQAKGS